MFEKFIKDEKAELMQKANELTKFMVLVGLVMIPIGYTAISSVNKTAAGIVTGSTQDTILTSILTVSLAVVVMALIGMFGKK